MNPDIQLQLQAYLDSELPEAEVGAVEAQLTQDATARDLLAELRQTRSLVAGQELLRTLSENREFYWSKIRRQIEREAAQREPTSGQSVGWRWWLRTAFSPVGSLTAVVALTLAGVLWYYGLGPTAALHETEVSLPNAQMLTFHDHQERMTVVWLTYNE